MTDTPAIPEMPDTGDIWRGLCEKDDRTSPEEYPDMALITQDELAWIMTGCYQAGLAAKDSAERDAICWDEITIAVQRALDPEKGHQIPPMNFDTAIHTLRRSERATERERIRRLLAEPRAEDFVCFRLCCRTDHCNAAEHAPDHDLSNDGYAERYGCDSKDTRTQAQVAIRALAEHLTAGEAT